MINNVILKLQVAASFRSHLGFRDIYWRISLLYITLKNMHQTENISNLQQTKDEL